MLRNVSEKLRAKFPRTTPGYSIVRVTCLDDVSQNFFNLKASPLEGQSRCKKMRKGQKGKVKKIGKTKSL